MVRKGMNIVDIFKVFSRRHRETKAPDKQLTSAFRQRVVRLLSWPFPVYESSFRRLGTSVSGFWLELRERLLYLHGIGTLSGNSNLDPGEDIIAFLSECNDDHFLDVIEFTFQSEHIWQALNPSTLERIHVDTLIECINQFFEVDDLPYHLTGFSTGENHNTSFPRVIRRDNTALHQTAIEPTLTLLSQPGFGAANEEFLNALKDFRGADYGDCVVKCGSSIESVMKIICDKKSWPYNQNDTASGLAQERIATYKFRLIS